MKKYKRPILTTILGLAAFLNLLSFVGQVNEKGFGSEAYMSLALFLLFTGLIYSMYKKKK